MGDGRISWTTHQPAKTYGLISNTNFISKGQVLIYNWLHLTLQEQRQPLPAAEFPFIGDKIISCL